MEFAVLHIQNLLYFRGNPTIKKYGDFKKIRGGNHKIIQGLS